MKAKELLALLDPALDAVHPKTGIPVLACVRFGGGKVTGSDMDLWATVALDMDAPDICVPAEPLRKALAITMSGDCDVSLKFDGGKIVIKGGGRRANISTLDAAEYPAHPSEEEWLSECEAEPLAHAAKVVLPAASTNETLWHMCGVAWSGEWAVGASPAAILRRKVPECSMGEPPILPPRLVAALPLTGTIKANRNRLVAEGGAVSIISRLIDGNFPDYERILPATREPFLVVDAGELASLVKAIGWSDSSQLRIVTLEGEGNLLRVSSRSQSGQVEAAGEIEAECAEPVKIDYNGASLQTVLAPFDGAVSFARDAPQKPAMISQPGGDAEAVIAEVAGRA